jgi:hypothetical protein
MAHTQQPALRGVPSGSSPNEPLAHPLTYLPRHLLLMQDEEGHSLSSLARLDTCVTVVDALGFHAAMASATEVAREVCVCVCVSGNAPTKPTAMPGFK